MNKSASVWDRQDLDSLLMLEELSPLHYRNRYHDPNAHSGRAYGGQVMGQALMAAGQSVPESRRASAMQALFLQGTKVDRPIDYMVTPLQDGKRFSSRHVRGIQGDTPSLEVNITFQTHLEGPSHGTPGPSGVPGPEELPRLADLNPDFLRKIALVGYPTTEKPSVDFRLVSPEQNPAGVGSAERLYYWLRTARPLPAAPRLQEAALVYLSDWWTNFTTAAPHAGATPGKLRNFMTTLNHSLWIHRVPDVHDWMLVVAESPTAGQGRGLSVAHIYDQSGDLLASAVQESLLVPLHF